MTQLTIVTTPTNSGDGTPLATAFNYCNSNFSELYARVQTSPPATLTGVTGDVPGMYAYDSNYFYYCFANYTGNSTIWGQVTQVANIAVSSIQSGTSNVKLVGPNGDATVNINGTSNIAAFRSTGAYVIGILSATGNIRGSYILGNGSQLTGLPATYSNANVAAFLPVYSGNISADIITANTISTTGNITGSYILGNGSQLTGLPATYGNSNVATFLADFGSNTISTTGTINSGNITGGNVATGGIVSATGNITGNNIKGTNVSASGTVTGSSLTGTLTTASQTNVTTVGTLSALSVSGNITTNNINTSGTSGNISGANIISAATFSATGNITGSYILGNGSQLTGLPATYGNSNVTTLLGAFGSNTISTTGTINSGNITGGNVLTGGQVSATGNVSGGNIQTAGQISATGNVTSGNVTTIGNVVAQGIVSASGNIVTAGYFVGNFQGNVTGNLVVTGSNTQVLFNTNGNVDAVAGLTYNKGSNTLTVLGIVSSQGNVIGGNLTTAGQVSATGNITGSYILGNGSQLTGLPATYGNSNVNTLLAAWGSNTLLTTGNITGNYILGNGSQLTGLPATYGNSNVTTLLGAFGSNSISTTGNITSSNIITSGTSGNITGANIILAQTVSATGNIAGANATVNNMTVNTILSSPLQTKASTDTGTAGQICWDANYIYVCTATNTWKRVGLTGGY